MGPRRNVQIKDTTKSDNLSIEVTDIVSLDEMEANLRGAATELGLTISHITVLGRRRYPGNRHWHLKRGPNETGCLAVTYWPDGPALWVTIRHSEPEWVHASGRQLREVLGRLLREQTQ